MLTAEDLRQWDIVPALQAERWVKAFQNQIPLEILSKLIKDERVIGSS